MHVRFLLGPAGSGKTFLCLSEIRDALVAAPDGPPLLLLAPKQATFQLERQLLADPALPGYTRLQILSFERLAEFVLSRFADPSGFLQESGRVMVLRSLLGRHQSRLKIFRATARLPGFAQQLNLLLRELQRQQLSPLKLATLARQLQSQPTLSGKLQDAALLLDAYLDWLKTQGLRDADSLLDAATEALRNSGGGGLRLGGLWLDGFAEMTPEEIDLLAAFLPMCERATLAFCVDCEALDAFSWLSGWSVANQTVHHCRERITASLRCEITTKPLERDPDRSRFAAGTVLRDLEKRWADSFTTYDAPFANQPAQLPGAPPEIQNSLRLVVCSDPEAEATLAAREILRFVRAGGRFRETAVLLRRLEDYDDALRRVFLRYGIPFFLDRRERVTYHPLAELTRYALRLAAFGWQHDDWFGALKTGLVTAEEVAVDRLENEAIARGWEGNAWMQPLKTSDDSDLEQSVNRWLKDLLPPFVRWNDALASVQHRPSARQLAAALRELWTQLDVERTLDQWSAPVPGQTALGNPQSAIHPTVLDQMSEWIENVELAFGDETMALSEWLPVLEAGLANLTVGVIPPALDQVLIGAIDRSRNPELKLVVLPGWNETVFPALPPPGPLLTEAERETLARQDVHPGLGQRQQIGRERFYAYIACTRARERLVISCATQNADDQPLNPSPFFDLVQQLSGVAAETFRGADWRDSEHACEIATAVLRAQPGTEPTESPLRRLGELPALSPLVRQWRQIETLYRATRLTASAAEKMYGRELHSSVSGLEDFAACPFKFFAGRGLRLQERKEFRFDDRDKGSFQHEVLCEFHRRVRASGRRWRDLSVEEARRLVLEIGRERLPEFGGGRFLAGGAARFTGEILVERLGRLMTALIEWMPQFGFDTELVELGFGLDPDGLPAWIIELPDAHALRLRGRIDRVDLCRAGDHTFAVVMDYKSSVRALNPTRLHHGLELQLLSYLGVLRHVAEPEKFFGAKQLAPAGVFYVPLNGGSAPGKTRADILDGGDAARRAAYQHSGRFLAEALPHFDNRGVARGDQFRYSKNKDGALSARGNDAMPPSEFDALRQKIEGHLRDYGRRIFEGEADVSPFRCGKQVACDRCDFRAGCRFDPWTQPYRVLRPAPRESRKGAAVKT